MGARYVPRMVPSVDDEEENMNTRARGTCR